MASLVLSHVLGLTNVISWPISLTKYFMVLNKHIVVHFVDVHFKQMIMYLCYRENLCGKTIMFWWRNCITAHCATSIVTLLHYM
jgi:hypothetical protein